MSDIDIFALAEDIRKAYLEYESALSKASFERQYEGYKFCQEKPAITKEDVKNSNDYVHEASISLCTLLSSAHRLLLVDVRRYSAALSATLKFSYNEESLYVVLRALIDLDRRQENQNERN
jgi:hypothetical protein